MWPVASKGLKIILLRRTIFAIAASWVLDSEISKLPGDPNMTLNMLHDLKIIFELKTTKKCRCQKKEKTKLTPLPSLFA